MDRLVGEITEGTNKGLVKTSKAKATAAQARRARRAGESPADR